MAGVTAITINRGGFVYYGRIMAQVLKRLETWRLLVKTGDLVRNLNSESRMTGIVIGWTAPHGNSDPRKGQRDPVILWADGRCNWIVRHRTEVISESR